MGSEMCIRDRCWVCLGSLRTRIWPDAFNPVQWRAGAPYKSIWPDYWNPVEWRAGSPSVVAHVTNLFLTLRAGAPRTRIWPDPFNPTQLLAGSPRTRIWPDNFNPTRFAAGSPRTRIWPDNFNPVEFRAGAPSMVVHVTNLFAVLRAGMPRLRAHPEATIATLLRCLLYTSPSPRDS